VFDELSEFKGGPCLLGLKGVIEDLLGQPSESTLKPLNPQIQSAYVDGTAIKLSLVSKVRKLPFVTHFLGLILWENQISLLFHIHCFFLK
jgi:hypothetical protein